MTKTAQNSAYYKSKLKLIFIIYRMFA